MHPYEIKVQMQERGQDRLVKGNASVYDTVERLAKGGYVEAQETSREGRRPERTVYRITDRGRDQMHEWLREMLSEPTPELPQLSAALMFIAALPRKGEVISLLQRRIVLLEAAIAATGVQLKAAVDADVPRLFLIEDEFANHQRQSEVKWVRELIRQLEDGTLPWPEFEPMA